MGRLREAPFVEAAECAGLIQCQLVLPQGGLDRLRELAAELVRVVLHVAEHLADGVALNDLADLEGVVLVDGDVNGVGVAEEVVQVAECFLIRPDQAGGQVVLRASDRV